MKKRMVGIFCLLLLLAGGCSTVTAPVMDKRDMKTLADDGAIKANVAAALVKKSPVKATDVNVHSFRGHVFLIGEADQEFRAFAYATAQAAKGVVHVTPHWFPTGTGHTFSDTALETQIDTELLFAKNVRSTQVIVDVWGGHVVLTGIMANRASIDRAISSVRKVPGVKSVTSYLSTL